MPLSDSTQAPLKIVNTLKHAVKCEEEEEAAEAHTVGFLLFFFSKCSYQCFST